MAVFLFTYRGYGTWYPDRPEGFVRRRQGLLPPDEQLAVAYRNRSKKGTVWFGENTQQIFIEELFIAAEKQRFRLHFVATETTHLHVLASWRDDRHWKQMRSGVKSSLTRRLNRTFERRTWFVDSASRRHVEDQEHFDYLIHVYLPEHRGWKWCERRGMFK